MFTGLTLTLICSLLIVCPIQYWMEKDCRNLQKTRRFCHRIGD